MHFIWFGLRKMPGTERFPKAQNSPSSEMNGPPKTTTDTFPVTNDESG
jgi:hypothetical protein